MPAPAGWDAARAVDACPIIHWRSFAWRLHRARYEPTDVSGSLRISGRYHRALDRFPEDQVRPALYLALGPEIPLAEVLRHVVSWERFQRLQDYRLTRLLVELTAVLDCREASRLGLTTDDSAPTPITR